MSLILYPLKWVFNLTGRLVTVVLGLVLLAIGTLFSITVIGTPVGVPIALLGFAIIMRGLF